LLQNDKFIKGKDLPRAEMSAYKPAYKENPKIAENQAKNLPADLAETAVV